MYTKTDITTNHLQKTFLDKKLEHVFARSLLEEQIKGKTIQQVGNISHKVTIMRITDALNFRQL